MYKIILLFCFILVGCHFKHTNIHPIYIVREGAGTPIKVIPVYIDPSFTKNDKASITRAINTWNTALNGYIILKIESTNCQFTKSLIDRAKNGEIYLISEIFSSAPMIVKRDSGDNATLGLANKIGGNWFYIVRDRLTESDIYYIALHELGHLLGSDHTKHFLMQPYYNKSQYECIDDITIEAVADYWRLPLNKLNYCTYYQ